MSWLLSNDFLFPIQLASAILMTSLIMMQSPDSGGLGAAFGGSSSFYRSRRGVEKIVFNSTIVLSGVFMLTSFVTLYAQ